MLLCEEITYRISFKDLNINYNSFKFVLKVHNYDHESALISLTRHQGKDFKYQFLEFEELKIPQNLTAKKWIGLLALKHDPFFETKQPFDMLSKESNLKILHYISTLFKVDGF